jgi:hypothetical protein
MTRYLLDTTALIDFSKGREPARSRILQMIEQGDDLGVCCINIAEFYAGLPPELRRRWNEFFDALMYWDITRDIAEQAGAWRHDFARQGVQLSTADVLIAAAAHANRSIIITNNGKDFPMPGVQVQPLRN